LINFKNVTKKHGKYVTSLKNINLRIKPGEFVFVVGASGSGKSTMLKLITKEEEPTSGYIFVSGGSISKIRQRELPYYKRTIGVISQDSRIIANATIFENLAFAMRVVGSNSKNIAKHVPYVLSLVSLEDKVDRKPSELSGGEKQRVGIARAIINNPKLIIADEPTGNVDPSMSYEILELLSEINSRGTTVIMATHDISMVEKFPFRVIELSHGEIRADSSENSSLNSQETKVS
jgi:cell division transport system ATP-binding protein